jgi:NAD+ synthase (glutamine-hydrolysing)
MAPRLGAVEENLERHLRFIERAKKQKARLVVFPELSLTGYTLMDLVPEVAIDPSRSPVVSRLKSASRGIDVVFGFMMEKARGIYHNTAAYLSGGEIVHLHRKVFLPTGGMFEEAKFFARGRDFAAFDTPLGRAGVMVCRDFLSLASSYLLFADGAEIIIVISAAPGRGLSGEAGFATSRMWRLMGEAVAYFSTSFVIYCNRVGFEDGKAFGGGSFVFSPAGQLLFQASELDEELAFVELDPGEIRVARTRWTFKRDDEPEIVLRSLARIVRYHED